MGLFSGCKLLFQLILGKNIHILFVIPDIRITAVNHSKRFNILLIFRGNLENKKINAFWYVRI